MKMSMGQRALMLAHWLVSLLICVALAFYLISPGILTGWYSGVEGALGLTGVRILGVVLLVAYLALAAAQLCLIFRRKKREERGFISVDSSDTGNVRISVAAIEQMVRQSVHSIDGITEMKIDIDSLEDAIEIGVNAIIVNGCHVPTITMNMQRSIRQFVEVNCGVAVRKVSISINAVSNQQESARRRFGRGKGDANRIPAPIVPTEVSHETGFRAEPLPKEAAESVPAVAEDAEDTFAPETVYPEEKREPTEFYNTVSETDDTQSEEQTEVYDFDKPYESQFAKDLAAMKAAEAHKDEADGAEGL